MSDYTIDTHDVPAGMVYEYRARLEHDPYADAKSPRDNDGKVAVIVCKNSNRLLPQEDDGTVLQALDSDYYSHRTIARWLRVARGATVVLPIYSTYGNGISAGDESEFDRGTAGGIGIAYDTPETRAHLGDSPTRENVEEAIRAEVSYYESWASGGVFGYVAERRPIVGEDEDWDADYGWEEVTSCWGFIGPDRTFAMSEAVQACEYQRTEDDRAETQRLADVASDDAEIADMRRAEVMI